jgi:DNA-directed RNA polymerase specialized sigma24 family protein
MIPWENQSGRRLAQTDWEANACMTRDEYGRQYARGFERTVRFLVSRGVERNSAPDVAQSAWLRGWERIAQLREDRFVLTWVNSIALNVHRKARRVETPTQVVLEKHEQLEEFQIHGIDLAAIDIAQLLEKCRPADRSLLEQQMRGATTAEIAREQGITQAAVRIRMFRARRDARSLIAPCVPSKSFFAAISQNAA